MERILSFLLLSIPLCIAMEKEKKLIFPKNWKPTLRQVDAPSQKLLDLMNSKDWQILEQSKKLLGELDRAETLKSKTLEQMNVLYIAQHIFSHVNDYPIGLKFFHNMGKIYETTSQKIEQQLYYEKTIQELTQRKNVDHIIDPIIENFTISLKKDNDFNLCTIITATGQLITFLNDPSSIEVLDYSSNILSELDELKDVSRTKPTLEKIILAVKNLNRVKKLKKKVDQQICIKWEKCIKALEISKQDKCLSQIIEALKKEIAQFPLIAPKVSEVEKYLMKNISEREPEALKILQKAIIFLKNKIAKKEQHTLENHKEVNENHKHLKEYFEDIISSPFINNSIKDCLKEIKSLQKKFLALPLEKKSATVVKSEKPSPKVEAKKNTDFAIQTVSAYYSQEDLSAELQKWKRSATLDVEKANAINSDGLAIQKVCFVSNGNAKISLDQVRKKRNSKKPYQIVKETQLEIGNTKWVIFEPNPNMLVYLKQPKQFYLYNVFIDNQNIYPVESILALIESKNKEATSQSSDESQDPATDEK